MNSLAEIRDASREYIALADEFAKKCQLQGKAQADHIGYKCASKEAYEHLRAIFEHESKYIHQAIISNRRISMVCLKEPIHTALGDMYFFELSDQKPDGSQEEGFDHIEFFPTDGNFDELVSHIQSFGEMGTLSAKPHHTTHNFPLSENFIVKIEPCAVIEKIKNEEM